MKALKFIFFLICLYIYLYNPILQVLGFGTIKLLLIVSTIYLLIIKGYITIYKFLKTELVLTTILILYSFATTIMGDGTAIFVPYQHLTWFLESFIISIFLLFYFNEIFEKQLFESLIIIIGTIASMITLYLITNPSINTWVRDSVIIDALDTTDMELLFRGFTFAETSSFGYGIIQGLVVAFCLNSIKKSAFYAIPIIPLLISILFNARIGFSVVIISLFLLIIYKRLKLKTVIIGVALAFIGAFLIGNSNIASENSDSMEWGLSFFTDSFNAISGGDTSNTNYEVLINEMLILPDTFLGLIFGEGRSAYGLDVKSSDIGYINEVLTGGLVYLAMLLFFLYYMFKKNLEYTNDKFMTFLFISVLLIVNIKGTSLFVPNGFFRLFVLYYLYCIFFISKKNNEINTV